VSELVPTVKVPRGDAVWELRSEPQPLEVAAHYADGIAVLRGRTLVHESYDGEMDEDSLHLSQSVGKSVLGLVAGILVGDGRLDPEQRVTEIVPEVQGSGYERATVKHLLDMRVAIDFVEDYEQFVFYDAACGWHPPIAGAPGTILEFLPTIGKADWDHGDRFHYAAPNTDLLGIVVERVAGEPLADVIAVELWAPMGAERDAELTVDPAGTAAIGGGFCATLRDYARLGALVAAGGRGIVPREWIERLGEAEYANQWWMRDGRPTARGIHGQLIAADPNTGTVVTILSSWPAAEDPALDEAQRALVKRL